MIKKTGLLSICLLLMWMWSFHAFAEEARGPLILKTYGPGNITAGVDFNVLPDGNSAIWTVTENATPTSVLVLNGVQLQSWPSSDGKVVTAIVPKSLYEKPGEFPLYLVDTRNGDKSETIKFMINP